MPTFTFLAIATEWLSRKGGISTFNRELCRALRRDGHNVWCYVPTSDAEERNDAAARGVNLIQADVVAGTSPDSALFRKPPFRDATYPDVIIGHGRFTGPAARAQADDYFIRAARTHFVHTAPGELEFRKGEPTDRTARLSEEREDIELELAASSDLVVAVGPLLYDEFKTLVIGRRSGVSIHQFNPGLMDSLPAAEMPPQHRCLVLGRAEDISVKGLDIAARAVALVHSASQIEPILIVRGAPLGTGGFLQRQLEGLSKMAGAQIRVKEYTPMASKVSEDIRSASALLMPSRAEGFGLVGLEAISMEVPVLLSRRSGLARLLTAELKELAAPSILPVFGDVEEDAQTWAASLNHILINRRAAFEQARILRKEVAKHLSWTFSVNSFLGALGATPKFSRTNPVRRIEAEIGGRPTTGAKPDVRSLEVQVLDTNTRACEGLFSTAIRWGPSLFSSSRKVANVCEVLLALDESTARQRSADLVEPIDWLLAQQRQGGFPSLSRDLVTTQSTALGALACSKIAGWICLPDELRQRAADAASRAAEACLRMAGERGWGTWGKGTVRIQPTLWALRAAASLRQGPHPELLRRFELVRMIHSAGAPGCFGFKPGTEPRISPTASFLLLCADLDTLGYVPPSPDRYYLEKHNAAQYLSSSRDERGGWPSEVELYYVDPEYVQFVGNVEQLSWFHISWPLAIEALCRNPELTGRSGAEASWLEGARRMLEAFDLASGMYRDPVIIEAGLTEAVFPTAYACSALGALAHWITRYEELPEYPQTPVLEYDSQTIKKVGAAIFKEGRLLLARKFGTNKLIMPGGGVERGEDMSTALRRELLEELGVEGAEVEHPAIGVYRARAGFERGMDVEITLHLARLEGVPTPSGEIEELVWFGRDDNRDQLTPIIRDHILPDLFRRGLL